MREAVRMIPGALREQELFRLIFDRSVDGIVLTDAEARIVDVNPAYEQITGYSRQELVGQNPRVLKSGKTPPEVFREMWEALAHGGSWQGTFINRRKSGEEFHAFFTTVRLGSRDRPIGYIGFMRDITELRRSLLLERALRAIDGALLQERPAAEVLDAVCDGLMALGLGGYWVGLQEPDGSLRRVQARGLPDGGPETLGPSPPDDTQEPHPALRAIRTRRTVVHSAVGTAGGGPWQEELRAAGYAALVAVPLTAGEESLGVAVAYSSGPGPLAAPLVEAVERLAQQATLVLVTSRRREAERRRTAQLELLWSVGHEVLGVLDLQAVLQRVVSQIRERFGYSYAAVFLVDGSGQYVVLRAESPQYQRSADRNRLRSGKEGIVGWVAGSGVPLCVPDVRADPRYLSVAELGDTRSELAVPIRVENRVVGVLDVQSNRVGAYDDQDRFLLEAVCAQLAIAIENARLYEATVRQLRDLAELYELSMALQAVGGLREMLELVVRRAAGVLGACGGVLLLWDRDDDALVVRAVHELDGGLLHARIARDPQAAVWRCLNQKQPCVVGCEQDTHLLPPPLNRFVQGWRTALVAPLRAADADVGVLMVGYPQEPAAVEQSRRLAGTLAGMAGQAIQRAALYEELEQAYAQTVLALSNAIDTKDTYTGGHGERLSSLAEAVAREMGCTQAEIEAIRWGALLHDIGKIGVPDRILQKPGPLDPEEWEVMRRHPEIGARIVEPVRRLQAAVPIIRFHHERWDGTGYPHGLKEAEIPLAARILAVVDAYAAMTDDRVYRKGRTPEQALAELRRCAGTQLDPEVVEAFVRVLTRQLTGSSAAGSAGEADTTCASDGLPAEPGSG